jgi:hypothetical protein
MRLVLRLVWVVGCVGRGPPNKKIQIYTIFIFYFVFFIFVFILPNFSPG